MTSTASAGPATVVDPSSLLTDGAQLIGGQWVPASRVGRTMSAESVLDYTQIKTVVINA